MSRYGSALACVLLLVPMASKCEADDNGGSRTTKAPTMIANGSTRITGKMVGATYTSKGVTDSGRKKGYKCEWRVINKDGSGDHFGVNSGPVSITFRARNKGGVFVSHFCRMWILIYPYS